MIQRITFFLFFFFVIIIFSSKIDPECCCSCYCLYPNGSTFILSNYPTICNESMNCNYTSCRLDQCLFYQDFYGINCASNPGCFLSRCRPGYQQEGGTCHDGGPQCRECCYGDGNCRMRAQPGFAKTTQGKCYRKILI